MKSAEEIALPFVVYTAKYGYNWSSIPSGMTRGDLDAFYRRARMLMPEILLVGDVVTGVVAERGLAVAFSLQIATDWDANGRNAEYAAFAFARYDEAGKIDFAALLNRSEFQMPDRHPPTAMRCRAFRPSAANAQRIRDMAERLGQGAVLEVFDMAEVGPLLAAHGGEKAQWAFGIRKSAEGDKALAAAGSGVDVSRRLGDNGGKGMSKIAIVGCDGSGKTVFVSALSDYYKAGNHAGMGCIMVPADTVTRRYTDTLHRVMRINREWPPATNDIAGGGVLRWDMMLDGRQVTEVQLMDFGGENFRYAFRDDGPVVNSEIVDRLKNYIAGADFIVITVALDKLVRCLDTSVYRNLEHGDIEYDRDSESEWITRGLLKMVSSKVLRNPPGVVIALSQADKYRETLKEFGGAEALFRKCWPMVSAVYPTLSVVPLASVDSMSENGMPAEGYRTDGVLTVMKEFSRYAFGDCDALVKSLDRQRAQIASTRTTLPPDDYLKAVLKFGSTLDELCESAVLITELYARQLLDYEDFLQDAEKACDETKLLEEKEVLRTEKERRQEEAFRQRERERAADERARHQQEAVDRGRRQNGGASDGTVRRASAPAERRENDEAAYERRQREMVEFARRQREAAERSRREHEVVEAARRQREAAEAARRQQEAAERLRRLEAAADGTAPTASDRPPEPDAPQRAADERASIQQAAAAERARLQQQAIERARRQQAAAERSRREQDGDWKERDDAHEDERHAAAGKPPAASARQKKFAFFAICAVVVVLAVLWYVNNASNDGVFGPRRPSPQQQLQAQRLREEARAKMQKDEEERRAKEAAEAARLAEMQAAEQRLREAEARLKAQQQAVEEKRRAEAKAAEEARARAERERAAEAKAAAERQAAEAARRAEEERQKAKEQIAVETAEIVGSLRKAVNDGALDAGRNLVKEVEGRSLSAEQQKQIVEARAFFDKLEQAKAENVEAAMWLAGQYRSPADGSIVSANPIKAYSWYAKAATYGSAEAYCRLSQMLEEGAGCSRDLAKSGRYCLKAARMGCVDAMFRTGSYFAEGTHGFEKSLATAYKYLKLAEKNGCAHPDLKRLLWRAEGQKNFPPIDDGYPDNPDDKPKVGLGEFFSGWL